MKFLGRFKKNNKSLIVLLLLFFITCSIFSFAKAENEEDEENLPLETTDSDFYDILNSPPYKHFVIFYLNTCPHCKKAMSVLQELSKELKEKQEVENDSDKDIRIISIDCDKNHMTCIGFDVKQVPLMIKVFDGKYTQFNSYPHIDQVREFINQDQEESEYKDLPARLGYVGLFLRVFKEFGGYVTGWMREFLERNDIKYDWDDNHSIYLMIIALCTLILLEVLLIVCCCGPSSKKNEKKVDANEQQNQKDNGSVKSDKDSKITKDSKDSDKTKERSISENSNKSDEKRSSSSKKKKMD